MVRRASARALNPAAAGAGELRLEQLVGADTELGGDPLELRQVLTQQVLEQLAAAGHLEWGWGRVGWSGSGVLGPLST